MKITLIGTTAYQYKMGEYIADNSEGNVFKVPAFDNFKGSELEICNYNRKAIKWADEVHVFWDGRSTGTIFDLGMCFAMDKKIRIIYLQEKSLRNFIKQYEERIW